MAENTNDNDAYPMVARPSDPDPHGQAAILLVESLIHGLIENSVITVPGAIEIVESAAEAKAEIGFDLGDSAETMDLSLEILAAIADSLRTDDQPG